MSMAAIKLSILFQYLRLLDDHPDSDRKQPKGQRIAVIVLITITSIWGLVYSVLAWVPSIPISADWDFQNTTAHRYGYGSDDKNTFAQTFIIHGACNMAIDVAILVLPMCSRSMWATAGRQKQSRIAMVSLYALGVVSVVCSIIRFASLVEHKATTYPTFDPTWYSPTPVVLSILEVDIAAIMASLPVFWPYLRRNIDRIMITHEIEVKVEEPFTQIDDQADESGKSNGRNESLRSENTTYTPWADGKKSGDSAGLKLGDNTNVVMMRDFGRRSTDGTTHAELDSPYDGSGTPDLRSPLRVNFFSGASKEGLLRR